MQLNGEGMNKGILLCVDDEAIMLVALKDQLRKAYGSRFIIEVAESAEEGLEILEELVAQGNWPLVIISDWLMPGMKGDQLLIEVHRRFPHAAKVMLSGQVDQRAVERVRDQAGLQAFIAKPWDGEKLITCISQALQDVGYQMS